MNSDKQIKVTVLYNEIPSLPYQDEKANLTVDGASDDAKLIADALSKEGFVTDIFNLTETSVNELQNLDTDVFFNLCDGIGELPNTEAEVCRYLDAHHLKYTGAGAEGMETTTHKAQAKKIFQEVGAPTPKFFVFDTVPQKLPEGLNYPLFVKPEGQDCSIGITQQSVVKNDEDLLREIKRIVESYHGSALAEEFIVGREVNLTLLGNGNEVKLLPISEIVFGDSYDARGDQKIVDFKAKWEEETENYKDTEGVCPAKIPEDVRNQIENWALKIFPLVHARDYARMDLRLSNDNVPYFIEVNVNPDLSPGMGATRSATAAGFSYSQFMKQIVLNALARYEKV